MLISNLTSKKGIQISTLFGLVIVCTFGWIDFILSRAPAFPRADTEVFLEVILGQESLWNFIWTPGNEHYAPLTRLYLALISRWTNWDLKLIMSINLVVFALALLFSIWCCIKKITHWFVFSMLLIIFSFHPAHYEIWTSACSYAPLLSMLLVTFGVFLVGDFYQNKFKLFMFILTISITLLFGPLVGGFLIAGYIVALSRIILFSRPSLFTTHRFLSIVGLLFVFIFAGTLILTILKVPAPAQHATFIGTSTSDILSAFWKLIRFSYFGFGLSFNHYFESFFVIFSIIYLGKILWSSISIRTLKEQWTSDKLEPIDHVLALSGPMTLILALAYGRANYPHIESSRYFFMSNPVWILATLIMINQTKLSKAHLTVLSATLITTASIGALRSAPVLKNHVNQIHEVDRKIIEDISSNQSADFIGLKYGIFLGMEPQRVKDLITFSLAYKLNIFKNFDLDKSVLPQSNKTLTISSSDIGSWKKLTYRTQQTISFPAHRQITALSLLLKSTDNSQAGNIKISLLEPSSLKLLWTRDFEVRDILESNYFFVIDLGNEIPIMKEYILEFETKNENLIIATSGSLNTNYLKITDNTAIKKSSDIILHGLALRP